MKTKDILGHFTIIGTNQDASENTYKGKLFLSSENDTTINAKWIINDTLEQFGTGYFKNNRVIINFYYEGIEGSIFKGKVIYKCLTKDILEGLWREELGNPEFFGTENCFRIQDQVLN